MKELIKAAARRAGTLSGMLGTRFPILGADILGEANPALAAAVSRGGGLGVLSAAWLDADAIGKAAEQTRGAAAGQPFAISLNVLPKAMPPASSADALWQALGDVRADVGAGPAPDPVPDFDAQFEEALAAGPAAVIFLHGGPREVYKEALEARGIVAIAGCTSLREAKVLRSAQCEAIIAQGCEAAGERWSFEQPGGLLGLMALLPQACRVFPGPVLASGAIMSAQAAAAAMLLGASGAWISSALALSGESRLPQEARQRLAWSDGTDAQVTSAWTGAPARVLESGLQASLEGSGIQMPPWPAAEAAMRPVSRAAMVCGALWAAAIPAGQYPYPASASSAEEITRSLGEGLSALVQQQG